ncbi:MAG: ABC transporter ATP-binding protein [Limnothrix sp. CACIAM 69d]|nr:MAG: ABC transporter ATP-binding protein [Limnothrix sp. CACIAM 69d]
MTVNLAAAQTPSDRRSETDWRLFLRLVPYARRSGKLLIVSLILLLPLSLGNALQPILVGQAISLIRGEASAWDFLEAMPLRSGLNTVGLLVLVTVAVRLALQGLQGYLVQEVGQRITADIRNDLFDHVTALAMRFFDRTPVGRLITRLTSDVDALGEVFSTGAIGIVSDLLSIVVLVATMLTLQWQLALLLLLMLIPIAGAIVYFQGEFRKANYRARERLSDLNSMLQENLVGVNVVQLFRRERYNAKQFRKTNQDYIHEVDRTIFFDSAVSATLEWISLVAIAGVLWYGGALVAGKTIEFGTLAAFILFAQRMFDPLREFAEKFTAIQAGFTAIERINGIFSEPIEIQDPPKVDRTQFASLKTRGEIRFEHVSFGYKADEIVLHDLDFTIHPGEKVAFVGPTGAGKSSIIRLLSRLYEVTEGRILLDGVDIRDMAQADLRRELGIILQDGFLFSGDVKSNITLGENYGLTEVQAAAERVSIDEFIRQLPQGYDSELRERGTNLSGGQKQLLAFARVAIREPKVLILDEATSSLDVATEAVIQAAVDRMMRDRTAIIIAHRLSTIRNVDRIFALKRGRLAESGTHDQLMDLDGLYASLYRLQMLGANV